MHVIVYSVFIPMLCRKKYQVNVLFLVGTKKVEKKQERKNQLFPLTFFDICYEYASYFTDYVNLIQKWFFEVLEHPKNIYYLYT
jgi:hypothetical protein